jgi:hypothetical protein
MRKGTIYSLHPGFAMEESSLAKLKERTGKTLEQWIKILKKDGPPTEKERREWIMKEHKFTTNYASWVAQRAEGRGAAADYDPDAYVEEMFKGSKAAMKPVYDALLKLGLALGKDVKACPSQTIVPLYRTHVFAQLKPSTKTRIDLGLALKDRKCPARLIDTGGFAKKDRITHRIEMTAVEDIDEFVKKWLRMTYESNG